MQDRSRRETDHHCQPVLPATRSLYRRRFIAIANHPTARLRTQPVITGKVSWESNPHGVSLLTERPTDNVLPFRVRWRGIIPCVLSVVTYQVLPEVCQVGRSGRLNFNLLIFKEIKIHYVCSLAGIPLIFYIYLSLFIFKDKNAKAQSSDWRTGNGVG